ncbi:S8/S53 family peptidase [Xanthomonas vasicola]|uniref:Peptidase S53 n=4 Tax=Xanthomonas vasicola TaxID=56459 RepID=A0A836P7Y1_XANVA|nr:S53 family peptidase [Xanthomonas vasicola]KEZ97307.1 peptidase S53 [Xanthomonas vasicola pv. vasculorum NCPPB 895]KFA24828.1 peptidase S53 [Xanthomonas vasicola pv. vasculorum NCPPB 1326]KFA29286.1 peptidase S53 [Xanthomonas vasicola pv. vasculorum NCPPB 1381]MBV6747049.1 S53 family peptidase [Xanthomonas vasicola pv. vasculorum NCPPB 890]MBV6892425.1 S53 family peptidase [Xanthomonas vasicola pv. vasculorum]
MHTILTGSERHTAPFTTEAGQPPQDERLRVLLAVRMPALNAAADVLLQLQANTLPVAFTRAEFSERFAASAADLQAVADFAASYGLTVERTHADSGNMILEGTVQQCEAAFQVCLREYVHGTLRYRGRTGPVSIPQALTGIVTAVLGLDARQQAQTLPSAPDATASLPTATRPPTPVAKEDGPIMQYTPPQLAQLYGFPEHDGRGQCIGIIALGGGYAGEQMAAYFAQLQVPMPTLVDVLLPGATNTVSHGTANADVEAQMDIQIAGTLVPGAKLVVYFAPNTDNGFLEAINAAIHDAEHSPGIIAISWGFTESQWTPQSRQAYDCAFRAAALMGITVCIAAGDDGASNGQPGLNVCFPASSPFVLACGGTRLQVTAGSANEQAWANGGGGESRFFARPAWQKDLRLTDLQQQSRRLSMRGVPDVAANADAQTGYYLSINGQPAVMGGTSAAAPLWAALLARIYGANRMQPHFVLPRLYGQPDAFRDIVAGNNGGFRASTGWDANTGLGVPYGARLTALLQPE